MCQLNGGGGVMSECACDGYLLQLQLQHGNHQEPRSLDDKIGQYAVLHATLPLAGTRAGARAVPYCLFIAGALTCGDCENSIASHRTLSIITVELSMMNRVGRSWGCVNHEAGTFEIDTHSACLISNCFGMLSDLTFQ
ncbi:hypothetical protein FGSG_13249 [Fusarium graminearum PH-1]|uniref:Chromosome 4, complete genome n=1 Tax=Gibberella zeae (strain ATCC MYA-4620 / CBS 123657 / FGSC 9075 / NRRL 31084 / PH-1) TaxID=229533 RepID=I1S8S1_GIBZE|nr:hypothetical protein FGSG_13249 [Fusarium graminearum PH-1]ESU14257.1 hypothetical protein FGSG_13249 [Fusarium graminearum PH-1]EYB30432.1 hypothetical protein FG05_13249 [Fusarium graminearum]CEF83493.1 unnamed protein product [Fusarium graminearum]|eukprot:XP_011327764.1 hypothetical protein FGSG_13249 [Fusarium graminearum PH-1]